MKAILLIFAVTMSFCTSFAGVFGAEPPKSFKQKLIFVPLLNGDKPVDVSVEEFEKHGFGNGAKTSWEEDGNGWILTVKVADKMSGKTQVAKYLFLNEAERVRLARVVDNGKELDLRYAPQIMMPFLQMTVQSRGISPRAKVDNPLAVESTQSLPEKAWVDDKAKKPNRTKSSKINVDQIQADQSLQVLKEEKKKIEEEKTKLQAELKQEKLNAMLNKIVGRQCGNSGTSLSLENAGSMKLKIQFFGGSCKEGSFEATVSEFNEATSTVMAKIAEGCLIQLRPDGQKYTSGREAAILGVDGGECTPKIGCEESALITTYTPCKEGSLKSLFGL